MIQVLADETDSKSKLYPFTATRKIIDIRIGILTIRGKWETLLKNKLQFSELPETEGYSARLIPSESFLKSLAANANQKAEDHHCRVLEKPWNIFEFNDWAIKEDFKLLTQGRLSEVIPASVTAIEPSQIFIEKGAKLSHCILNASTGPIYIGKNAEIMEGSMIRGPFALCEGAVVKMGAKIYGATTIGPYSVVGGEIKNSVIFGYSNKAHDGYLGDSVIGEWCNLGAGTSNSNLRNNANNVKVWDQTINDYADAGLKCGLLMGDYSRAAINTSFNTGTVVGVSANVFCSGLTQKYIPDFSWGDGKTHKYLFEKAVQDISNWKKLKNKELSPQEIQTLKSIFEHT